MQARLKLLLVIGMVVLFAFGLNMVFTNGSKAFAEGSGGGEKIFQSNCMSCHSIGGGNGIGPDLKGVTKLRDEEWLKQMILDPKALVDSGDETANQLLKDYGMLMPTIELSDSEIASIISYLKDNDSADEVSQGSASNENEKNHLTVSRFAMYGFLGSAILFAMMSVVWRKRLRGVRKSLR